MKRTLYAIVTFLMTLNLEAQNIVLVKDADVGSDVTDWTANNEYHLDGYVFVPSGGTLNIEAGTVIKGLSAPSSGDASSALIVARGATINAIGNAENPIILTAEFDDVDNPNDLTKNDKGLWGGLLVLGAAPIGVDGGVDNVEGIPSTEGRAQYGGTNPNDNSGILKYITIRHGGAKLEANNEINGLTLAGVGRGTSISYVEVFANLDDGIEWFGGNVDVKYAAVSFCGDDSYDYDQSWDGRGQFWFTIQDSISNRAGEWDGSESSDLQPKVSPVISNMTLIGAGNNSMNDDNNDALRIRDDAAAHIYNSILTSFARGAIVIDNDASQDSWQRFLAGDITFNNNLFYDFGAGSTFGDVVSASGGVSSQPLVDHLNNNDNDIVNPVLGGISRSDNHGLDPRPDKGSPALGGAQLLRDDAFFDPVPYRGAFGNANNWLEGWTALDNNGFIGDLVEKAVANEITITDSDINPGEQVSLTADNIYLLDGYVFVEDGAVLTIDPGTVIKGLAAPSSGDASSALIISKGGKIMADGTADFPIIFTAEFDNLESDDLTKDDKGLWGGLIILGNGVVGVDGGVTNVEGIPSTEGRAEYGGNDNSDNSGIIRYVSIRHGGDKLEANNEINGLTLGGVGNGTVIDYIEIFANLDDGIEWFGGAVDVKHSVVSFCGDDSYDYDQSWDGRGQFWFTIQDSISNRAGEWDGSEAADLQPQVSPVISNMTLIGAGNNTINDDNNDALRIRDDAAAHIYNSILTGFARNAIAIDNDAAQDSWQRFLDGDITFTNNVFDDFGGGTTFAEITSVSGGTINTPLVDHLVANGSVIDNSGVAGISRTPNGGLDPRINGDGAASGKGMPMDDAWFEDVSYIGAFDSENNWALGWTALDDNGFFGSLVSAVDDPVLSPIDDSMQVFPNPVSDKLSVSFEIEQSMNVNVAVIDMFGRTIVRTANEKIGAGFNTLEVDMRQIASGTYLVTLNREGNIISRRVVIRS